MKNSFLKANLISLKVIRVLVFADFMQSNNPSFILKKDDVNIEKLKILKHISNQGINFYELEMTEPFDFGHRYLIQLESFTHEPIDVSEAPNFKEFDDLFYYDGDDLGATYTVKETTFALWAPLACSVILKLEQKDHSFTYLPMQRGEKGVYRLTVKGDHLNQKYTYLVTNGGVTQESLDPYGKGSSCNAEHSVVVDIEYIKKMGKFEPKPKIINHNDHIIYELHIRDFTENKFTDIENKGKYLGLVEPNRKTVGGHPAGLDYLKYLGVTTIQVLPVIDYKTVDEANPKKNYNWGYDPISFFALEGGLSSNPHDGMSRLIEFKTMVNELHKNNLRIIMDVVYNHIYEYLDSCFEKVVPNYYFRRRNNGQIAMASGCGDDVASEKKMVSKAICDSLKYFTEVFDVDGFRFDLMGLLDIHTINHSLEECQKIKDNIFFYGEGWNMGIELPYEQKACSDNASKMPEIGFFNDLFRDVIKGPQFSDSLDKKGYMGGGFDKNHLLGYCFSGSTSDYPFNHRFLKSSQSINYVECHDNNTIFDKLSISNGYEDKQTILKRVAFANTLVMYSIGVPLFHMGQEIGLSKSLLDNTYNIQTINNMNWKLVDERFEMVDYFKMIAKNRREVFNFLKIENKDIINNTFKYQLWDKGVFTIYSDKEENIKPFKRILFIVNPNNQNFTYEFDTYYSYLNGSEIDFDQNKLKNGMVNSCSVQALFVK